jgi:hypothetical protein
MLPWEWCGRERSESGGRLARAEKLSQRRAYREHERGFRQSILAESHLLRMFAPKGIEQKALVAFFA